MKNHRRNLQCCHHHHYNLSCHVVMVLLLMMLLTRSNLTHCCCDDCCCMQCWRANMRRQQQEPIYWTHQSGLRSVVTIMLGYSLLLCLASLNLAQGVCLINSCEKWWRSNKNDVSINWSRIFSITCCFLEWSEQCLRCALRWELLWHWRWFSCYSSRQIRKEIPR